MNPNPNNANQGSKTLKICLFHFFFCLLLGLPIGLRLLDGLNRIKVKIEPTDRDDELDHVAQQVELEMRAQLPSPPIIQPSTLNFEKQANRDPRLARLNSNSNGSINTNRVNIQASTSGHQNGSATVSRGYNFNDGGPNINTVNFQASTSGLQNGNSTPYFGNRPIVSAETATHTQAKQRAFLAGTITASDLISGSSQRGTDYQQKKIRDTRNAAGSILNTMNSPPPGFFANIPTGPFLEGGRAQQRSPLIVSNRNALFLSQASTDNVQEALLAQRYRNISQSAQKVGVQIGTDLDALSRDIKSESAVASSTEVIFIDNTRTIFTQTDFPSVALTPDQREASTKAFKDQGVQTTKNNGVFSIILDLAELTKEKRNALDAFKRVIVVSLTIWHNFFSFPSVLGNAD